jgi:hypothetical protein
MEGLPTRESFWGDHCNLAVSCYEVSFDAIKEEIEKLQPTEKEIEIYGFAFVNECKDTIYANYDLRHFEVRKSSKSTYYYRDESYLLPDYKLKDQLDDYFHGYRIFNPCER